MTGAKMRAIRERYKLTMEELSAFLGLTRSAVSRFEKGDRAISGPVCRLLLLLDHSKGRLLRKNPWNRKNPC